MTLDKIQTASIICTIKQQHVNKKREREFIRSYIFFHTNMFLLLTIVTTGVAKTTRNGSLIFIMFICF